MGWVLLHCGDGSETTANAADDTCFEAASTTNAGETWSVVHQKITEPLSNAELEDNGVFFSGYTWLEFVDPLHGWEILDIVTDSVKPSTGEMFRTVDGGKTWTGTKDCPTSDHFHFITTRDGWIAGGKEKSFFVTHDAGDSWRAVSLPKAPGTEPNFGADYDLPVFQDALHGFMSYRYDVDPLATPTKITSVFLPTDDGGMIWRPEKTFAGFADEYSLGAAGPDLMIVRTETVRAALPGAKKGATDAGPVFKTTLSFRSYNSGQAITSKGTDISFAGTAGGLSFLGPSEGWRIDLSDKLFATKDGGANWKNITPVADKATSRRGPKTSRCAMSSRQDSGHVTVSRG